VVYSFIDNLEQSRTKPEKVLAWRAGRRVEQAPIIIVARP